MKKICIVIIALLSSILYTHAQLYVDGYTSLNTLTIHNEYDFFGNIGIGYNNKKFKIGVEFGLNAGIPYKNQNIPVTGSVTFGEYVEGETYNTNKISPKRTISINGNIYSNNNILTFNQFVFGINAEWFIIRTFTNKIKWFDIGIFSGIGLGYYHTNYSVKYFQPYIKAGIELDFNIKDATIFLNGDIRYFSALNNVENQTIEYHSYIQQCVGVGIRYTIPINTKSQSSNSINRINNDNKEPIIIYNTINANCNANNETDSIIKIVMLPTTIFFANNRYDIRKTEFDKLDKAADYIKTTNSHVKLIGMASNIGSNKHNKKLSLNRCISVMQYLIDCGVPYNNIEIEPTGDNNAEFKEEPLDRCVIIKFK